ncbi:TetR/AcrR family transcriptional regulator [Curtobacterium sp. MCJR17_043]|uniref:TetR/AcrR family transcriptional regulator n=1 Tax=Curtobacterium sp. MCJR17_043 TaxID=2175660 RepID=UPI0024DFCC22|nr:TetR/AcrR family transcriptional regulator [Curtobacterium sp. MCJR17_043]WIB36465.1 helix-turn-helix domain-containing protein [Curtobacterium sp. MCJR17_043]
MTTTDRPTRAPRRDATENRAALVQAARTLLQADPDASLEAIAAHAGLSRRAVYGHFPSRDDLVREVVTGGAERILAAMPSRAAFAGLPPASRLAAIAVALWTEVSHVRSMAVIAVRGPPGRDRRHRVRPTACAGPGRVRPRHRGRHAA